MTIIEAIAHESKLAEEGDAYHKQLADWLVKLLKAQTDNDRLRELLRELYEDQCIDGDQWKYRDRMCELEVDV